MKTRKIMYQSPAGKIVFKFFKEKEEEFQFHLGRLQNSINEEDIHYLRRATKRIKAIYKLFQQIEPEFNAKKRFSSINPVYENAGLLREIQVNQNTLLSYRPSMELIDRYSLFIHDSKVQYITQLAEAIENFKTEKHKNTIKEIKSICRTTSKKKLVKSSNDLIQIKFSAVKELLLVAHGETDFHTTRILIKQLSPTMAILEFVQQKGFDKDLLGVFKSIEDKMGYWHDRDVLQQSLKQLLEKNKMEQALIDETNALIIQLEIENAGHLKKIASKLRLAIERLNVVSSEIP